MTDDLSAVEAVYTAALKLAPAERAAFLDEACREHPTRRAEVERLLAAHGAAGAFLEPNAAVPPTVSHVVGEVPTATWRGAAGTASFGAPPERADSTAGLEPGAVIAGRYRLAELIGEGGMGAVWLAHQTEPVKRSVAIKVIKAGMDSRAVLARFEAERQALALMDHPNIAKVLDAGATADGRPFFVMELVKGTPITEFCDARRLGPRERLELFVSVCQAIQHAHQKGIIHRDIKPSNVLVALYDERPVVKVIDFGVAKATGPGAELGAHTGTGFGAVVGTPEYMSPEQATFNNLDIDTRTDVYALGVLLYELLAGAPPFSRRELEREGLLEILRVVREEEPPKPSTKVSTADAKASISANRNTEPAKLAGLLRSELDWLVMKALEKDRGRRYGSANEFAADVQRYLAGEPVQAVPPSRGYRLRKWVRKNRGVAITCGLVAGTLAVGLGGTTWGLLRAEREAERARVEEQKVRAEQAKTLAALEAAQLNLARGYLRPVGFSTGGLDRAELIALDALAREDDDRVKLLFLREAMSDPERALRVARRAERVVQAAVGTSLKRREAALKLISEKQRDTSTDSRVRLCACWLAIELGSDDLPALKEGFDTLKKQGGNDLGSFLGHLPGKVSEPASAVVFDEVLGVLNGWSDWGGGKLRIPIDVLIELAPSVTAAKAARGAEVLAGIASRTANDSDLWELGRGLRSFAPRLDALTAGSRWRALTADLSKRTGKAACWAAGAELAALAPGLAATDVRHAAKELVTKIGRTKDADTLRAAVVGLTALTHRLDPVTAGTGFEALASAVGRTTDSPALRAIADGLSTLAPRLDPATSDAMLARAATALVATLDRELDWDAVRALSITLAALAQRLDGGAARTAAGRATDKLLTAYARAVDGYALPVLAEGLAALTPRLDEVTATTRVTQAVDALLRALDRSVDGNARWAAAAMTRLAPRIDRATAGVAFTALLGVANRVREGYALGAVAEALAALSTRLDPVTAQTRGEEAVRALFAAVGNNRDGTRWAALGSIASLSTKQDATAAQTTLARVRVALLDALADSPDEYTVWGVATGLQAMAPQLDTKSRQDCCVRVAREYARLLREGQFSTHWNAIPRSVIGSIDSIAQLSAILNDPGCIGELRTSVLARLEQLAYPDPAQAAVFVGLAADPLLALALPALQKAADEHRQQTRRFRTVSDAAKWLDHHPELDLDSPYHKVPAAK